MICTILRKPLNGGGILSGLPCACLNIEASRVGLAARYPTNIVLRVGFESLFPLSGMGGTLRLNTDVNRVAISLTAHNSRQPNRTSSVCNYGDTGSAARFFKTVNLAIGLPTRRDPDEGIPMRGSR